METTQVVEMLVGGDKIVITTSVSEFGVKAELKVNGVAIGDDPIYLHYGHFQHGIKEAVK